MVVTTLFINVDGSLEGLQPKNGLDLRVLGKNSVKRASDIKFCEDTQKWYIEFLLGDLAGKKLSHWLYSYYCKDKVTKRIRIMKFDTYEEAVSIEVEFLNAYRRIKGHL
jgi:hypothetical protein